MYVTRNYRNYCINTWSRKKKRNNDARRTVEKFTGRDEKGWKDESRCEVEKENVETHKCGNGTFRLATMVARNMTNNYLRRNVK